MSVEPSSADVWAQLVDLARADRVGNDDVAASLVALLNRRGDPEVVDWALPLLASADRWAVHLAAWVLQQHGFQEGNPFGDRVNPVLLARARTEPDDDVRADLVNAIGFSGRSEWVAELIGFAGDRNSGVRQVVAANLPVMFGGDDPDDTVIAVLVTLSRDVDPRVRDWATMGLGTQVQQDSEVIRAALRARLGDDQGWEDGTAISGEAALGLARRGDRVVLGYLAEALAAEPLTVGNLIVEAAGVLGDPVLLPRLLEIRDAGWAQDPREPLGSNLAAAIDALQNPTEHDTQ